MEGATSSHGGLTRRGFLKTTAAAAGAAAVVGGTSLAALADGEAASAPEEQTFSCICRPNCTGYCNLNVHVRDGRAVKVTRKDYKDPYYTRGCLRGLSHVHRIYDDSRVKYPMKRVEGTERGAGEWERISWDEAVALVAENFKKIQAEYGTQAICQITGAGDYGLMHGSMSRQKAFATLMGMTTLNPSIDSALWNALISVTGALDVVVSNDPKDYVNANSIFAWGVNYTEAYQHSWHSVAEAKEAGAKLVVIDPVFTQLASKADIFVPIRHGADAALALGMMNVMFERGLQNDDFLTNHTCAPFLVREDNGKFLHLSDMGVAPVEEPPDMYGMPTYIDPYVVWDEATQGLLPVAEAASPAITGTFEYEGVKCTCSLDLLKAAAAEYTLDRTSELTGVDAATIEEVALLAADCPVTHLMGYGSQAYDNGIDSVRSVAVMCSILGNIGYPGASVGNSWFMYAGLNYGAIMPALNLAPSISILSICDVIESGKFKGQDIAIKGMYCWCTNPVAGAVDSKRFIDVFVNQLDYMVVVDSYMSDTAMYADIVLPATHWFENDDVVIASTSHHITYSEKAVEPLFEAKPDGEIACLLGEAMGFGDYFAMSHEEFAQAALGSALSEAAGVSLESLKREGAIRYLPDPYIPWQGWQFNTPSGRMEFYLENPTPFDDQGQDFDPSLYHLPKFAPPTEAWPDSEAMQKYPFVLNSERVRYRVHSQWFGTPVLRELDPEPTVKMNPADAEARGLSDGAYVEVFNDRGHAVAKLVLSNGIRPGSLAYPKGWQRSQFKAGCWSELLSAHYEPQAVNSSFMDCAADVRAWEGE